VQAQIDSKFVKDKLAAASQSANAGHETKWRPKPLPPLLVQPSIPEILHVIFYGLRCAERLVQLRQAGDIIVDCRQHDLLVGRRD
jgi:hypothetical protein